MIASMLASSTRVEAPPASACGSAYDDGTPCRSVRLGGTGSGESVCSTSSETARPRLVDEPRDLRSRSNSSRVGSARRGAAAGRPAWLASAARVDVDVGAAGAPAPLGGVAAVVAPVCSRKASKSSRALSAPLGGGGGGRRGWRFVVGASAAAAAAAEGSSRCCCAFAIIAARSCWLGLFFAMQTGWW